MRPTMKYLSTACAGALLIACADIGYRGMPAAPLARATGSADDAYVLGRQQHLASRFPAAIESYQAALHADPRHVNATNGLATLYAEQGDFPKAIKLWQELTGPAAAASGPSSAFLFSNLGYAHFLNGDFRQAIAALERACVLDPLNHRAWRHLGSSLEKIGQAERAQLMYKQAATLEQHDFKADYALAQRSGVVAIDSAVATAPAAAADGWATTEVRKTGSGMFELRRAAPAAKPVLARPAPPAQPVPAEKPVAAAAPEPEAMSMRGPEDEATEEPETAQVVTSPVDDPAADEVAGEAAVAEEPTRLEIRNGNGVTGMARSMASRMGDASLRVTRLSNEKGFNVEHTRVEYQGGFREAANRLAERFGSTSVHEVDDCHAADVRLVIGRDLVRSKAEARRIIKAALARAAKAG